MGAESSKLPDSTRIKIYKRVSVDEIIKSYEAMSSTKKSEIEKILKSSPLSRNYSIESDSDKGCYVIQMLKNETFCSDDFTLYTLIIILPKLEKKEKIRQQAILGLTMEQYNTLFS